MIKHNTVLVLGAGASCPYGFPLGQTLIDKITREVSYYQSVLWQQLIQCSFESKFIKEFSDALNDSPLNSIDIFLETRPEFSKIGRTSIAISLLPCESVSRLMDYSRSVRLKLIKGYEGEENSWYHYLFTHLHDPGTSFGENKLRVITFNYDRSFEHFLFLSVQSCYPGKNDSEIASMIQTISIIHLYGSLGRLPWQKHEVGLSQNVTPFGAESLTSEKLPKAADSIQVISDNNGVTPEFDKAKEILENAEHIYFLGFGFYKKNIERLGNEWSKYKTTWSSNKIIRGTAYHLDMTGIANAFNFSHEYLSTETLLNRAKTPRPTLFDEDVYTFLYNHVNFST
jgi:hypothetical protein